MKKGATGVVLRVRITAFIAILCLMLGNVDLTADDWRQVYTESFDELPVGAKTTSKALPQWEGGSASGVVSDAGNFGVQKLLKSRPQAR